MCCWKNITVVELIDISVTLIRSDDFNLENLKSNQLHHFYF